MQQHDIHQYLDRFFRSNHCDIVTATNAMLDVQLTIEMDKLLMNRPFYWHYLEKTGGVPNPMRIAFITDNNKVPEEEKGEIIHFGSPLLHQIFQAARQLGSFIRLFEDVPYNSSKNIPLHPWLCMNVKVSYQCDRKKDMLYSLGLHLITGTIISNFHDILLQIPLTPKIPDFCFTLSPIIKPKSGLIRIEEALKILIAKDDHTWAEEAKKRWEHDQHLLDEFYDDKEDESYKIEKQALREQYEPKIVITIINGGIFYVTQNRIANITTLSN